MVHPLIELTMALGSLIYTDETTSIINWLNGGANTKPLITIQVTKMVTGFTKCTLIRWRFLNVYTTYTNAGKPC